MKLRILFFFLLFQAPAFADVEITELNDRIRVEIDGELFTEWRHQDWLAPYFYPVIGPTGETITRNYPMREGVAHESQDHPHHRSLRFAHSDVNGLNFWYWRPGRERELSTASIVLEKVESIRSGEVGEFVVWTRWLDGEKTVLRERLRAAFTPLANRQVLMDYDVELHAGEAAVTFGDMKDGGLFARVAGTMKAQEHRKAGGAKLDGKILNSRGDRNAETWGKRAEWVDYFGPDASGQTVGIAMFDHPSNLRFPTHWHSRTYGLLAANRFGTDHFNPALQKPPGTSCRPHQDACPACHSRGGDFTLAAGETLQLRHRLFFHHGDSESAEVARRYRDYAGENPAGVYRGKPARLVFESGEEGYPRYRIPTLIVTKGGDLLAICQGRVDGGGLTGDVDLVGRRSDDGGRTWSDLFLIADMGTDTLAAQSALVDRETGVIWIAHCLNPGEHLEKEITAGETEESTRVFLTSSEDDGRSWSEPREITSSVKKPGWTWVGVGPGVGIQLQSGRLFFPAYHREGKRGETVASHAIFSDDGGKTWNVSTNAGTGNGEPQALQREDGSILLSARTSGDGPAMRSLVESRDEGATWGPKRFEASLYDPHCQASLLKLPALDDGTPRWLYCHPAGPGRHDLTVRLSTNEGRTWDAGSLLVREGNSQYSSMARLPDGRVGLLYDAWGNGNYQLYFTAFTPEEIRSGDVFRAQGELAGEITTTTALLQTRLTATPGLDAEGDVEGAAGVARFEFAGEGLPRTEWFEAAPEDDFIIRAKIEGLEPGTLYRYRVIAGRDRASARPGPMRSFRTLPGAGTNAEVNFCIGSCMIYGRFIKGENADRTPGTTPVKERQLGYPSFAAMKKLEPDFFVGTGDIVYYDWPRSRAEPAARTLPQLRKKWHEQFRFPRLVEFFANTGTYWSKDDHDFRFDDADLTGEKLPLPRTGIDLFREQLPIAPAGDPDSPTYRTYRVSRHLQLWLTEGRDHRSPNTMADGPGKTLWGKEQREWIQRTLGESDATWKILISPTPMVGPDGKRKKDNHTNLGGFRHEAESFFAWLGENKISGFLAMCGDRHWQYHSIHPTGIEEFGCGALNDENAIRGHWPGDPRSTDPEGLIEQPFRYAEPTGGFLHILSREDGTLRIEFRDDRGELLHAVEKSGSR